MFLLSRIFLFLTKSADQRDRERDDAYLTEATDIYDLEYRMKALDKRKVARQSAWQSNSVSGSTQE
ncbi:Flp pilus assembly protein CpaB [Candidatus Burkholderia brachyanthoides]|nr:Flp pilus assembly protein CpaB [Candidatus Burkholderia brachyanthoides]